MRSNKGIGRQRARYLREEKEEAAAKSKEPTPKQLYLANATPSFPREKKVVVSSATLNGYVAELRLRRCTANKRRKLLNDIRDSK
jgi:hypothetical protein